jgi:hypothetical protein
MPCSTQAFLRRERREFQHPLQREEHIRTEDRIIIAARHPRYSSIILFFSLTLLFIFFAGPHCAIAETPGQPGTKPTTTVSDPVSAETTTRQGPSLPAAQQAPKTGQAPQPPVQTKTAEQFGPQVDPCYTVRVAGDNWLDQVHGYVQDNTCEPAVWFDTFFVKDHILLDLRPGMLIILRTAVRWTQGQGLTYVHDYNLEWRLPQWQKFLKKSKLYFESRSVANRYTTQPGQPVQPGFDPNTGVRKAVVGVRADLYARLRSLISFDSGVRIGIHPDAHIRMRYQYARPFGEVYLVRFSQIAMYQAVEHFTDTTQLDVERKFTTFTFVRWANNVTYKEGTAGVTWNTGVSLFTQLSPKSAISYDTNVWGVNHPEWVIQNYRIGSLYRRQFYRPFLFFELAPEVTWPKDVSQLGYTSQRKPVYAFMVTLEIQFGK